MEPDWHQQATCKALPATLFYGRNDALPMPKPDVEVARAACGLCPVARECLADALLQGDRFGIWGGFTSPERERALELYGSPEGVVDALDRGELAEAVRKL